MNNYIDETPIYIWGTGIVAEQFIYKYGDYLDRLNVVGFIDNKKEKHGKLFANRMTYAPEQVTSKNEIWIYLATNDVFLQSIKEQISKEFTIKYKIIDDNIFVLAKILSIYNENITPDIKRITDRITDRIYGEKELHIENNGKKQLVFWHNDAMWDDKASEYILMEPYYNRIDNLDFAKKKISKCVAYPFKTEKENDRTHEYINELCMRIIESNMMALNEYFNVEFGFKQWNMFIFPFIKPIIFDIYNKYCKMRPYANKDYYALGIKEIDLNELDTLAQMEDSYLYAAYRWSMVSRFLGIDTTNVSFLIESNTRNDEKIIRDFTKLETFCEEIKGVDIPKIDDDVKDAEIVLGLTRFPKQIDDYCVQKSHGKIAKLDFLKLQEIEKNILLSIKRNLKKRKEILKGNFAPKSHFEELAEDSFIELLPTKLFEAFPTFYTIAYDYSKNWNVRKIYDSCSLSALMILICCIQSVKGTVICDIQHSGAYIWLKNFIDRDICAFDRFCSWGCDFGIDSPKIIKVAMSRMPLYNLEKEQQTIKKILYTGSYLCTSDVAIGFNQENMVDEEMKFIDLLPDEIRHKLVIRTGNTDTWSDLRLRCQEKYPYIKFESRFKPFSESVQESEMIVMGYPGSPLFEAHFVDKPIIFFEAVKIISATTFFGRYKAELKRNGIYYDNIKECAKAFRNYEGLLKQLNSKKTKDILNKFICEATNCDKDVKEIWYSEFVS